MIKIIAVGNRFMKDDGIAIAVAEALKKMTADLNMDIILGETDSFECFYLLNKDDFVIVLDAVYMGVEPGSVSVFKLNDVIEQTSAWCFQHDLSILELMKLFHTSFRGIFIGIESADIGYGDELSPVLHEKLPQICSEVEKIISNIVKEGSK